MQPLTLGNKNFPVNFIQGPLAGISCAPFRLLTWQYSKPAFSCTEMISCKTIVHQLKFAQRRFIVKDPDEGPVCFQLSSSDPHELAEATKQVTDFGADLIDLNCGCPVKKICRKGAGSSLLMDPTKLFQLITAMKNNTHLPVSIKIRVEGNSADQFNREIAQVVHDAGADFLVVHGRHWSEHYETPCNHDQIKFFVDEMNIPVIGNGDIADLDSLNKMLATGCAGVMIGRAGVGQPWLIAQLTAAMQHKEFSAPPLKEIGSAFLQHVSQLANLLANEKFAIIQARKFARFYARTMPDKTEFCTRINICEDFATLQKICAYYFNMPLLKSVY
jgi:tRNA-dihydrouridine synthase B